MKNFKFNNFWAFLGYEIVFQIFSYELGLPNPEIIENQLKKIKKGHFSAKTLRV